MVDRIVPYVKLFKTEALDLLSRLPDESVDLIVTDPPYESLEKHRARGTTTRLKHSKASSNDWFKVIPNKDLPKYIYEFYRVLKTDRHFYLFCDQETMFVVKPMIERAGFKFWKPLVWDKVAIGMGYHYRARYEFILFCEKGKRKLNNLGTPDVLAYKRIHKGLPAEKPVPLVRTLISQSTTKGELVCDPFLGGSGCTAVSCVNEERHFVGSEIDPDRVGDATMRISNAMSMRGFPPGAFTVEKM